MVKSATSTHWAVEARGIHKTYPQGNSTAAVLKGIDLSVNRGEFLALLGPSGSGKSTLLHILGLMDKPTQGEVSLLGYSTKNLSEEAGAQLRNQHIGFVFQFDSLLPEFTALENVIMPGRIAGTPVAEAQIRARELLHRFNLKSLENRFPQEMSGGERQRVAVARALLNKPAVLLADEPTGNLDRRNGELVFNSLKEVAEDLQVAVVLVTHNEYATKFASRVLHLSDGSLSDSAGR